MQRKRLILVVSTVLLAGLFCLGIWQLSALRALTVLQAVPQNTALFLEYPANPGDTLSEMRLNLPFLDWTQAQNVQRFQGQVQRLWSAGEGLPRQNLLGLRAAGEQGFVPFGVYALAGAADPEALAVGTAIQPLSVLREVPIYHWTDSTGYRLVLSFYRNLCLASPADFAVEDAVRQLVDRPGTSVPPGTGPVNTYLQLAALPLECSAFARGPAGWLEPPLGDWLILECQGDSTGMQYKGRLEGLPPAVTNRWEAGLRYELLATLPEQAALAQLAEIKLARQQYQHLFAASFFETAWDGGVAVGQFAGLDRNGRAVPFLVHRLDPATDMAKLEAAITQTGELEAQPYQLFTIRQLVGEIALPQVLGDAPMLLKNPYLIQYENYLLWTTYLPECKRWLDNILSGQVLSNHPVFQQKPLPEDGQVLLFADPQLLEAYAASFLKDTENRAWVDLLQGPSWWLGRTGPGGLSVRGYQQAASERQVSVLVDWHTPLDAEIAGAPQLLELAGEPLILVQDARHQLYGLDEKGAVLWKKQLDGRVLSDFQKLQLFDNSSEQIIFNTAAQLYFINHKGEAVPGYPVALPAPASNGVRVLRFNERQDFAYFFACTDGTLYALDRTGKALPGWNPKDSLEQVIHPVEHFQTPGKDFILVLEADTLHVFHRDGRHRFPPVPLSGPFLQGPKIQLHPLSDRIVLCNAQGRAEVVNTEGASFGLQLAVGLRQGVHFEFADVAGDDRKDYLVLSGVDLKGYCYEGNAFAPFLSYTFPTAVDDCFAQDLPNRRRGIGAYSRSGRKIYLLDAGGRPVRGFPLAGDTAWFIFRSATANAPLAVVGLGSEVYAYDLSRCF